MSRKKPTILIADDEDRFRDGFAEAHAGSRFTIEQVTDVDRVPQKLMQSSRLPDLVVLDLYRTRSLGTAQAAEDNAVVDELLARIDKDTAELKVAMERLKEPAAIRVLEEIRDIPRLAKLPVLLYTRQGLSLLSDEEFKKAERLGSEWMLKGRGAGAELAQIEGFLGRADAERRRVARDVVLTVAGAVLGVVIGTIVQALM